MQEANMGCIASADGQITSKMSLAKCYLVFCGQQTPTFTYQTKSQSTFATNSTFSGTLHRNPCRAHITINDFQGGKCEKCARKGYFVVRRCSPPPTKPSRQALSPQKLRFLESHTCTQVQQHHESNENVAKNAHQTQQGAEEEENGKSSCMNCILPYGYPHVVHQRLRQEASAHVALDGSWTK